MDGGQFRVPPRSSRGTVSRPEPARRPMEEPQPQPEKQKPAEDTAPVRKAPVTPQARAKRVKTDSTTKRPWKLVLLGAIVAVLLVGGWLVWSLLRPNDMTPGIDSSKYQAVFLANGDIYFGKLESAGKDHLKLTNIYYIKSPTGKEGDDQTQQATDQNNVQLIKLGEEIYGPEDAMIIARDQVMLYENLKPDGKVAQAIDKYKKQ